METGVQACDGGRNERACSGRVCIEAHWYGVNAICGITKDINAYHATKEGLSLKKHQDTGPPDTKRIFEGLENSDTYKRALTKFADRVVATGKAVLPVAVIKQFLAVLSRGQVLVGGGLDLVAAVRGLDHFLAVHGGSLLIRELALPGV